MRKEVKRRTSSVEAETRVTSQIYVKMVILNDGSVSQGSTDSKHNRDLEEEVKQVNKHCQNIVSSVGFSGSVMETELIDDVKRDAPMLERDIGEARVLYKPTRDCRKSDSDCTSKANHSNESRLQNFTQSNDFLRNKRIKNKLDGSNVLRGSSVRSVSENFTSVYSTTSFRPILESRMATIEPGYSRHRNRKRSVEYLESMPKHAAERKTKEYLKYKQEHFLQPTVHKYKNTRKSKHCQEELNKDFITDLINRQYKPVKMFGRRKSDLSQFSAPICRDHEYTVHEDIQEGPELCSCCYNNHRSRRTHHRNLCEMRSICDTRLYSSKKHKRRQHRTEYTDIYNNSEFYDLIPVKEKSSPKSRRKFVEENTANYCYREVPPSPRTLRPKLNLKAQYQNESEDCGINIKKCDRKCSANGRRRPRKSYDIFESDASSGIQQHRHLIPPKKLVKEQSSIHAQELIAQDVVTTSSLQYLIHNNPNMTANTSLNKTKETGFSVDKTDKALCEIKDILQSFLLEIKKETPSQCDKSDLPVKNNKNIGQQSSSKNNTNLMQDSGHNFHCSMGQCNMPPPYMPPFPNTCCYPILPVCPINCVQNGYIVPSPSFTCANCSNTSPKEPIQHENSSKRTCDKDICTPETKELIKEIYKYVAQSPITYKKGPVSNKESESRRIETKILTSRSIGGSSKASKHDANVGTPRTKYYSKSCEAIGSKTIADAYSGAHATCSDTILEKLSLEATATDTTSETEFKSTDVNKRKKSPFSKVFRSLGIFKKKRDVIEELSESESAIDVEIKPKSPPFQQDITNYSMYSQEYYQQPSLGPYRPLQRSYQDGRQAYNPVNYPTVNDIYNPQEIHRELLHYYPSQQPGPSHHHPKPIPTAPSCHPYSNYVHPQVPLCLKEIEVKSMGIQSDRKMSFFKKIKTKIQPPGQTTQNVDYQNTCATQTTQPKQNSFNWKKLQKMEPKVNDPMSFLKTQRELAQGNVNVKKELMKKLFYKRNPFSPRNLIVRTLLGKDKSSFGAPPRMYKPRMFF